ncbi:hypothetical protein [Massilia glaciei]|uniref:Uncharacterized protein n=1 Tax=Massilia glaciei TaxID=1524097 RepID=A0A2U2I6I2_9BURK|nr:hypothetical protein [Massilia glaciei]PWF55356.1 hypothetical protein C7C56_002185 [Massilia glaciei]
MNIDEAKRIIVDVPRNQIGVLDAALERYKRFSGIYTVDGCAVDLAGDRATFPHLLKFDDGMPVISDDSCVEFMAVVSGLPAVWCAAWNEIDFMDVHVDVVS